MNYDIGDTVVHWTYGLGRVTAIDQKNLNGITQQYYVVRANLLDLWVPVEEADRGSIRLPMESNQFKALFDILRAPGKLLPDNLYQRKLELRERMQKRTPEDLCHLIRDLTDWARIHPLKQNEPEVLSLAKELLLDEWVYSLRVVRASAEETLENLLCVDLSQPIDQAL